MSKFSRKISKKSSERKPSKEDAINRRRIRSKPRIKGTFSKTFYGFEMYNGDLVNEEKLLFVFGKAKSARRTH